MAKISRRRLAQTVQRLLSEHPAKRAEIVRSLAAYLIEQRQTKQLDQLVRDIAREMEINEGVLLAEVQSAFPLGKDSHEQLRDYLKRATNAKKVELDTTVEPALLSGVVVKTADKEIDTSARRKLARLASLNSGGMN